MTILRVLIAAILAIVAELLAAELLVLIGLPRDGWINLLVFVAALVVVLHRLQLQARER